MMAKIYYILPLPELIDSPPAELVSLGFANFALFSAAIQQNVVLWDSKHLVIYAGEWQWALRLKLRRIVESQRQKDLDDAVCILKELDTCYGPLSKDYIRNFIPDQKTMLDLMVQTYEAKYGKIGID